MPSQAFLDLLSVRLPVTPTDEELTEAFTGVSFEAHWIESAGPSAKAEVRFRFTNRDPVYKAVVPRSELGDMSLRTYANILKKATVELPGLVGAVLGTSGRIDCIRAFDDIGLPQTIFTSGNSTVEAQTVNANGHGQLGKLPRELRAEIYKLALPQTFWQCYHSTSTGFKLLGSSHSDQTPNLIRTSSLIRKEFFDSAYHGSNQPTIIVGTSVIACNFPLEAGAVAGHTVNPDNAFIPSTEELFIGVQTPSPRTIDGMAMVRVKVKEVVGLINIIAANRRIPPIRVSFETNKDTTGPLYRGSDFEMLLTPFRELRLPPPDADLKYRLPLTIERALYPLQTDNLRIETCDMIESAIARPHRDHSRLTYRQMLIDVKLELALYAPETTEKRCRYMSAEAMARLAQAIDGLRTWYKFRGFICPDWMIMLHKAVTGRIVDKNGLNKVVDRVIWSQNVNNLGDGRVMASWASGHTSRYNPFFKEGHEQYWE
ncbi:hypothetical protein Q7P37_006797 [Cladosporium fusiforme]